MFKDWLKYFLDSICFAATAFITVMVFGIVNEVLGLWAVGLLAILVFAVIAYYKARCGRKEDGE